DSRIGNRQRLINPRGFDKAGEAAQAVIGNASDTPWRNLFSRPARQRIMGHPGTRKSPAKRPGSLNFTKNQAAVSGRQPA
ncbi:MAG TPA: hypothetical protein VKS24_19290, partial [Bradyrhizobium sp.]|nr:hypothetical protein [Bradyrhizobium sp.]